jgi:ubiquinone/menaquinone biosynthesis C-methylase UbiE
MKLKQKTIDRTCPESEIYNEVLTLDDRNILELGCGTAELTRAIASDGRNRYITALEVDERQHKINLEITDLPNVSFQLGGAEVMPVEDQSQDIIFMFKSLHHVPEDNMDQAMREIHRVLKSGGMAYISEPIFMGDFNDLICLFHNEQQVRLAAFNAIKKSVTNDLFKLVDEVFFNVAVSFKNFVEFETKLLNVTHTDHQLSDEILNKVKTRFDQQLDDTGAHFIAPMRVDLLQVVK